MSLWGNSDGVALTGTAAVATGGDATVTGTSTLFTTEIDVGDLMLIVDVPYRVLSIASATSLELTEDYAGSTASGLTVTKRETPRNLSVTDSDAIFGVSQTGAVEHTGGTDNVVSIAVDSAGSGYVNAADAAITFTGETGTSVAATSVVAAGKVTSITVTNVGSSYETTPVVVVAPPDNQTFNANVVVTADDTILLSSAEVTALAIDDAVTYTNGGGSQDIGLTTATVYYIHSKPDATHVKLKAAVNDLDAIVLTAGSSEGGHGLQGATATATATRGSGSGSNIGHPGWVKRTVGTGGRAGRIQYETLVAMSSITGDTVDDIEFPE